MKITKKQLTEIITESVQKYLNENKYKSNSKESNIVDMFYDTWAKNKQFPQLKQKSIDPIEVDSTNGIIKLKFTIDEIFNNKGKIEKIKPEKYNIDLKFEITKI